MLEAWSTTIEDGVHLIAHGRAGDTGCVIAAVVEGPVVMLDSASGARLANLGAHPEGALALGVSADGTLAATGGQDGKLRIFDLSRGTAIAQFDTAGGWIDALAWSPVGHALLWGDGKRLRLWSAEGPGEIAAWVAPTTISAVFWDAITGRCAAAGFGGIWLYEPGTPAPVQTLEWKASLIAACVSPDGANFASGNQDSSVHIWRRSGAIDIHLKGYDTKVRELAWRAEGPMLATGGGNTITLWDFAGRGPETGKLPPVLEGHTDKVTALAYVTGGATLVSTSEDGTIRLWDLRNPMFPEVAKVTLDSNVLSLAVDDAHGRIYVGAGNGRVSAYGVR